MDKYVLKFYKGDDEFDFDFTVLLTTLRMRVGSTKNAAIDECARIEMKKLVDKATAVISEDAASLCDFMSQINAYTRGIAKNIHENRIADEIEKVEDYCMKGLMLTSFFDCVTKENGYLMDDLKKDCR